MVSRSRQSGAGGGETGVVGLNPKFSIIIPVYNAEKYLADAVASVQAQSYDEWECVVVDDGSEDATGLIADKLAAEDGRIKVIHQTNAGVGAARNAGLDEATGEWVGFLDSDDELHPMALEILAKVAAERNLDSICFGYVNSKERPNYKMPLAEGVRFGSVGDAITYDAVGPECVCGGFYKAQVAQKVRFAKWKISEDTLYRVAATCLIKNYAILDASLYWYREVPNSAYQSGMTPAKVKEQLHSYLDMIQVLQSTGRPVDAILRRKISNGLVCRGPNVLFGCLGCVTDEGRSVLKFWRQQMRGAQVQEFLPLLLKMIVRISLCFDNNMWMSVVHILPYRIINSIHIAINKLR